MDRLLDGTIEQEMGCAVAALGENFVVPGFEGLGVGRLGQFLLRQPVVELDVLDSQVA